VLAQEPETAADAVLLDVTLPAAGFAPAPGGFRYQADADQAPGGIVDVRLKIKKDVTKITVRGHRPRCRDRPQQAGTVDRRHRRRVRTQLRRHVQEREGQARLQEEPARRALRLESGCDPLGIGADGTSRACLLPYPSDFFTADDSTTVTKRRIAYELGAMPANIGGTHVDPAPYNLLDGFSAGPVISTHFPAGVDLAVSHVPPVTDLGASLRGDSPTLAHRGRRTRLPARRALRRERRERGRG
jgi:hypothetical protein